MIELGLLAASAGTASKIASGLSGALSSLKSARELAKEIKSQELREKIGDAFDQLNDLREALHDLQIENESLRKSLEQRQKITRDPLHGYYFAEGDTDPLCPRCWERDGKPVHLDAPYTSIEDGSVSRFCDVCHLTKTEQRGGGASPFSYDPYR